MWSDASREAAAAARAKGAHSGQIDKLPARMTKAHFEVIAQQLRDSHPGANASPEDLAAHKANVDSTISRLAMANPRFDAGRFRAAVETGAIKMGSRSSSKANAAAQIGRMNKTKG